MANIILSNIHEARSCRGQPGAPLPSAPRDDRPRVSGCDRARASAKYIVGRAAKEVESLMDRDSASGGYHSWPAIGVPIKPVQAPVPASLLE